MSNLIKRTTRWTLVPDTEPIFSEDGFTVAIDDEAGGEYVTVTEHREETTIKIDPSEWPTLRAAINHAVKQCMKDNNAI